MRTITNLFGRSPFSPLRTHMEKVSACVHLIRDLFAALEAGNRERIAEIGKEISKIEHQADLTKNDIRNHLPKSLFMPIDRGQLLEILALQDSLADRAEDIAVLTQLAPMTLSDSFKEPFQKVLDKNLEAFTGALGIIEELHELLESTFGGVEAERVKQMTVLVAKQEHEADLLQRELLKVFFAAEKELTRSAFYLWLKVFESVADLSNLSEKLANRIRMTLELS